MKIQILIISFLVLISNFPAAYSEETGEEEASSGIGPGKAVTETSKTLAQAFRKSHTNVVTSYFGHSISKHPSPTL